MGGQVLLTSAVVVPLVAAPLAVSSHLALGVIPVWLAFLWTARALPMPSSGSETMSDIATRMAG